MTTNGSITLYGPSPEEPVKRGGFLGALVGEEASRGHVKLVEVSIESDTDGSRKIGAALAQTARNAAYGIERRGTQPIIVSVPGAAMEDIEIVSPGDSPSAGILFIPKEMASPQVGADDGTGGYEGEPEEPSDLENAEAEGNDADKDKF